MFEPLPETTERIAKQIVDSAFCIHKTLGPGLLESVYEACMCYELSKRGISFQKQLSLPVIYESLRIDAGLRLDLLVGDTVIVELKAVPDHHPVFEAQLHTYLKLTNRRLGLLINFNVPLIKEGIKRIVL
jgi:GxxExxY protein